MSSDWFELDLASHRSEVPRARAFVVEIAHTLGQDHLSDVVELLTSELATNAVLHGQGDRVTVRVRWDAPLFRVEVCDESASVPRLTSYSADAATGRGMILVQELSNEWGTFDRGDGKTVWFEVLSPVG